MGDDVVEAEVRSFLARSKKEPMLPNGESVSANALQYPPAPK